MNSDGSGGDGNTLPVELPEEHQQALEDPPEFTDEQRTYLEAILAAECCHMTGMHDPKHWREDGTICWESMEKNYKRALRELGLEVPVFSARGCGWCRDTYAGDESPFDSPHPTYTPTETDE